MNTTNQSLDSTPNNHHWMLWVAPQTEQIKQFKNWPKPLRDRILILNPRIPSKLTDNLIQAIETGYYAMITLPQNYLCELDEWRVKQAAAKFNTALTWK